MCLVTPKCFLSIDIKLGISIRSLPSLCVEILGLGAILDVVSPTLEVGQFCGHLLTAPQVESQSWGKIGWVCLFVYVPDIRLDLYS